MSLLLLLRPKFSSDTTATPTPDLNLGPGFIGGIDGSNLVPLKPKTKRKRKKEAVQELVEKLPEEYTNYIVELADIAPELLSVLLPESLLLQREAERLAFLRNIEDLGLRLLKQEAENYLTRLSIEQQVQMELELEAIRDRIDDAENEELLVLLIHKLH